MQTHPLAGKVALVAGATRQVGRGVAVGLAELGAKVYITSRRMTPGKPVGEGRPYWGSLRNTLRQIEAVGGEAVAVVCDHRRDEQTRALIERIDRDEGRLDILVNAVWAGYDRVRGAHPEDGPFENEAPFWRQPVAYWDDCFVGVRAGYAVSALAAPLMIRRGGGLIVHVSFVCGRRYMSNVAYGVAHAAIDRVAADMAHDLRPHGVAAVSLCPLGHVADKDVDPQGESGVYVGRVIAGFFNDERRMERSGQVLATRVLAKEYGVKDTDGSELRMPEELRAWTEAYPEWGCASDFREDEVGPAQAGRAG